MWFGDDLKLNLRFESFVNSKGCKTAAAERSSGWLFESFVNSKGCKTGKLPDYTSMRLRALLIQKDVKLA